MSFDSRVWKIGKILIVISIAGFVLKPLIGVLFLFIFAAHLLFFREPVFKAPVGTAPLAPAYGKIIEITEVMEERFLKQAAYKIGIFLSVFDPHITLSPVAGTLRYLQYVPGKCINALLQESSLKNESNWMGFSGDEQVLVRQLTGAIARRIYCDVKIGEAVDRAKKVGVICYGSRVECYVAKSKFKPSVQIGDYVKAGQTILGEWQ